MAFNIDVYKYQIFDLDDSSNGFKEYMDSTLKDLTTALSQETSSNDDVQQQLMKVSPSDAKTHEDALKYLTEQNDAVEYIGATFTTSYTGDEAIEFTEVAKFKSKTFISRATVYAITPKNTTFDLGFVNVCESRTTDQFSFEDTDVNIRVETDDDLPMSARTSNDNRPWYTLGVPTGRDNVAAKTEATLAGESTYDMSYNTVRTAPLAITVEDEGNNKNSFMLNKVAQNLEFTVSFAYKRKNKSTYRVIDKTKYGFNFSYPSITHKEETEENSIDNTAKTVFSSGNVSSNNPAISSSVPSADEGLPNSSLENDFLADKDKLYSYDDTTQLAEYVMGEDIKV